MLIRLSTFPSILSSKKVNFSPTLDVKNLFNAVDKIDFDNLTKFKAGLPCYANGQFSGGHRCKANFIDTNSLTLDIDKTPNWGVPLNEGQEQIEEFITKFLKSKTDVELAWFFTPSCFKDGTLRLKIIFKIYLFVGICKFANGQLQTSCRLWI